ncbi:MAG: VanZ family protein [Candidatus Aminicenantes bacterium]|nr:VanZ family protein [Candidatus Aminicenantes bacterium]
MKLPALTKKWFIVLYLMWILIFSVALFSRKILFHKTWVLFIRLDYLLHIIFFVPWMILIRWCWRKRRASIFILSAFVAGLLLAMFSEGLQYFLHYRTFDLNDILTNCLGIALGGMLSWLIFRGQYATEREDIEEKKNFFAPLF